MNMMKLAANLPMDLDARTTIDFGIDLGTTNSSIAVLRGTEVEVFKNNEGFEYTPSAVWLDKNNRLYAGRRAKERLEDDRDNAFSEFKLQLGTNEEKLFARSGRRMKPEELSAEVLKALKADVRERTDENLTSAVITVPAAFELPQCDATRRAAELAGFTFSPLLQEPVAAALAYGFQSQSNKVFWLVYDFGGGTFDAAIIQVRDGMIQVVNHGGDNQLGGKLIDWEIVDQLLIPALTSRYRLSDFRRGNPKWTSALAKLKLHAEEAKIRVSRDESVEICIDFLGEDDHGKPVKFEYELQKKDVEKLMEPFILRSVNICRKVLQEKRLGGGNIEKLIMVGGPTKNSYLRSILADRNHGLGIPLEFSIDPLTAVARGAAIFAGTQRLEGVVAGPAVTGKFTVELEYQPVGAETEPLVGGRVVAGDATGLAGYTIEFVNAEARPQWRSGRLGLAPNGTFMTNLWAEKGRRNVFQIELYDAVGTLRPTSPDNFVYTVGLTIIDPPLIHSVGVGLANNEMAWLIDKGTPLPARRRAVLKTTTDIRAGQAGHVLRIPVMEGQNSRADRNQHIGTLEIAAIKVRRDVPMGSEVEVTIEIDQSRIVRTKAYIPYLDEEFEKVISYEGYRDGAKDPDELAKDIQLQRERLQEARDKVAKLGDKKAEETLQRIDSERMVHDVDTSMAAAAADRDAADKCGKRLLDLKIAVDEVEDALEWPALAAEAEKEIESEREILAISEFGATDEEKAAFVTLEREIRASLATHDVDLLRRKIQEMSLIGILILARQPAWWVKRFEHLSMKKPIMTDQGQAASLLAQGQRAIASNNVDDLKVAVMQLSQLLPADDADRATLSDVTR